MENTLDLLSIKPNSQVQSLLYFLNIRGPQPSWVYWNRKILKLLTKEGYISFNRKTHFIAITIKGELWLKETNVNREIDIVNWMKDKSFCRLQRLITHKKCNKLIDHLARTNRLDELHNLFLKIREMKHKIWENRIVRDKESSNRFGVGRYDYLVLSVMTMGPYQIRAQVLDLNRNQIFNIDDLPRFEAHQFISTQKAECLKALAKVR
jgi:hypothetical protein